MSHDRCFTVEEACARLGIDPADDIAGVLQGAFQRALREARGGEPCAEAEAFREILDAYRTLRRAGAGDPGERRYESWPHHIELTVAEAVLGGMKAGTLPTGRPYTTRVPAGLRDGDLAWVHGWLLQARIDRGGELEVHGDDLLLTARRRPSAFKPGMRISVETPAGPWSFRLSDAAVEQRLVRVPGAGLPAARRHAAGDLYVRFELDQRADGGGMIRRLAGLRAA